MLPLELSGASEVRLTLSGPWDHLRIDARVEAHDLSYPPIILDRFAAELLIDGSRMTVGPGAFRVGDGDGEVQGTVAWGAEAGDEQLDLAIRGRRVPLEAVTAWLGDPVTVHGAASFAGGLRGSIERPRGSWALGLVRTEVEGPSISPTGCSPPGA